MKYPSRTWLDYYRIDDMSGVDSSYSWVVALAGSLISLLVSCPVRLGAQIFVSLLDRYDTTRKEASFPFVLAAFLRGVSGPFAGAFGDRIGLQGVTIFGCLLCSVGVGGCFFVEDVMTINICLGVIFGIGYGWSCALIPEIINQHFKKHRSIAYGITSSGGGLGSFFFPPILDLILKKFGVSGTFLIMAALLLNSVPAAMLLRKQKRVKKRANFLPLLDTKRAPAAEDKRISDRAAMQGISRSFEELCEVSNCEVDLLSNFQTDNGNSKIQLKDANMKQDTTDMKCPVADRKNLVMWPVKKFPELADCFFRGSMGSYDGLLYLMASMFAVCVILLLLLPILAKQRDHV
nr:monocarboxylate transporter 12-like [Parasteatoda tepidariorum]